MPKISKLFVFTLFGALMLAACADNASDEAGTSDDVSAGSEDDAQDGGDTGEGDGSESASSPDTGFDYSTVDYDSEPGDSALRGNRLNPVFPPPVIEPQQIRSGGPPPDGIPPIDSPNFAPVAEIDYLGDDEAVILVELEGQAKAYPIQVLIWHEIVNDEFGDVPVTVTYCPLCNSAIAFDRRIGDRVLDFGTSGELYQSALVMYDRQTETLWAHFTGQGLVGHYAGANLDFVPAQTVSFSQFRDAHPDGLVLTNDTGAQRRYGENPYVGYDEEASGPFERFFEGPVDSRELAKARIVGLSDEAGSVAVRLEDLVEQPVIPVTTDGRNLVILHIGGLASALDSVAVGGGRDVGQTGVFVAEAADGTKLTFTPSGDAFVDDQTGTTWNIVGQAIDGPLEGEQLESVSHLDTFWFAWATYRPDTTVIDI